MADAIDDKDCFEKQLMAAIEADDVASIHRVLDECLAADPDAIRRNQLGDVRNKAPGLGRYDIADALFKRGAAWNYATMDDVLEGAHADNDWNTKAVEFAVTNGWDINENNEHVRNTLV